MHHKQFWLIAASYGLMTGVYSGWGSFLTPNLQGFMGSTDAQHVGSYIGFYATVAGCVGGIGGMWSGVRVLAGIDMYP